MMQSNPNNACLVRLNDRRRFVLSGYMIIGRHENCDLVLNSESGASRKHARLAVLDEGVFITDLGSLNGTLVNGEEITRQTRLQHGDTVVFDEDEYQLDAPPPTMVMAAQDLHNGITHVPPSSGALPAAGVTPLDEAPGADAAKAPFPDESQAPGTARVSGSFSTMADGNTIVPPDPTANDLPHLIVLTGPATGAVVVFDDGRGPWSVGSAVNSDLPMRTPGVAIRHALIEQQGTRFRLVDQGGATGTFVNGERVESIWLEAGSKVAFGDIECRFHCPLPDSRLKPLDPPAGREKLSKEPTLAAAGSTPGRQASDVRSDARRTAANDLLQEPPR